MGSNTREILVLASQLISDGDEMLSCLAIKGAMNKLYANKCVVEKMLLRTTILQSYAGFYEQPEYMAWIKDYEHESQIARSLLLLLFAEVGDLD